MKPHVISNTQQQIWGLVRDIPRPNKPQSSIRGKSSEACPVVVGFIVSGDNYIQWCYEV